jgi:hypothetical protein
VITESDENKLGEGNNSKKLDQRERTSQLGVRHNSLKIITDSNLKT